MATRTISNTGGNYNAVGAWVEGAVPTVDDDVIATATSGQLTINVASVCRSIDLTGYTNTLTHATSVTLSIGTTTEPPSGKALVFPTTGWTYTKGNVASSAISFVGSAASSVTRTIDFGGKLVSSITFNGGVNVMHQLVTNGFTQTSGTPAVTVSANGKFDSNGINFTAASLSTSAANVVVNLGTSTVTFNNACTLSSSTGTYTTSGASLIFDTGDIALPASGLTFANITVTYGTAGAKNITGGPLTVGNLSITGTGAAATGVWTMSSSITVTGNLTLNGFSSAGSPTIQSSVAGTRRTFSAANLVIMSNMKFKDIVASGTTIPWSGNRLIDLGNNLNISFIQRLFAATNKGHRPRKFTPGVAR